MCAAIAIDAKTIFELLARLGEVFYFVVLPMMLLAGIGFIIQRKLGLDMPTMTRMNFYFVTPGMVYAGVVSSNVTAGQVAVVVGFSLCALALMGAVTYVVARLRRVPSDLYRPMLMTTMLTNAGNFGLPLQDLAFRSIGRGAEAMGYHIFVVLVQNFSHFTLGVFLAAGGARRRWRDSLLEAAKFPSLYALAAALLTIWIRHLLGSYAPDAEKGLRPFWEVVYNLRQAYVPVALCSLGAQLALIPREKDTYPVKTSVILRLLGGPAVGLALIYAFGIKGFLAQILLIGTSTPSSVNSALLCLQFNNHPNYVAKAVFFSTLLSAVSVTVIIFAAQAGYLPRLAF